MELNIKTPNGDCYLTSIPNLDITLDTLTVKLNEQHFTDGQYEFIFVYCGRTLERDKTLTHYKLDTDSVIIIVPKKLTESNESNESNSNSRTYNSNDIRQVLKKDNYILFNIIHLIAQQNPFFLSHIAVNPYLARQHFDTLLNSDDFKLCVVGNVEDDPIRRLLVEENSPIQIQNQHELDKENIQHILDTIGLGLTPGNLPNLEQDTYDHVKDMYLFFDRDVEKTIYTLTHVEETIVGEL
jgi:hypothetical protein